MYPQIYHILTKVGLSCQAIVVGLKAHKRPEDVRESLLPSVQLSLPFSFRER